VQPQGVAPSNPSAGSTLSFKEQLQARKGRDNLNKNLMQAVIRNNPASVETLLQQGADVNAFCLVDISGWERQVPPIYVAAHKKHSDVLRMLLQHHPDANAVGDNTCGTALLAAIQCGNEEGVEELLGAGADPNQSGCSYKGSPLMTAAQINATGILELLILAGADVNAKSTTPGWGPTALDTAAASLNGKCVRVLVNAGANVDSLANDKHFKFVQNCMAR
jgi:ankyrin repeat protein